jgi:hypothetical protein
MAIQPAVIKDIKDKFNFDVKYSEKGNISVIINEYSEYNYVDPILDSTLLLRLCATLNYGINVGKSMA